MQKENTLTKALKEQMQNINSRLDEIYNEQKEIISRYLDVHPSVFTDKIAENSETGDYFIIDKGESLDEIDSYYFVDAEQTFFDRSETLKVVGITKNKANNEILVYYLNDDWELRTTEFYNILNFSYYNILNLLLENEDWEIPCIETDETEEDY